MKRGDTVVLIISEVIISLGFLGFFAPSLLAHLNISHSFNFTFSISLIINLIGGAIGYIRLHSLPPNPVRERACQRFVILYVINLAVGAIGGIEVYSRLT